MTTVEQLIEDVKERVKALEGEEEKAGFAPRQELRDNVYPLMQNMLEQLVGLPLGDDVEYGLPRELALRVIEGLQGGLLFAGALKQMLDGQMPEEDKKKGLRAAADLFCEGVDELVQQVLELAFEEET